MRILLSFFSVLLAFTVMAMPAKRTPHVVTQPDGSQLTIFLHGDEYLHYYTDEQDSIVAFNQTTGWWEKSSISAEKREHAAKRRAANNQRRKNRMKAKDTRANSALVGEKRGIVILVQFPDKQFHENNTPEVFHHIFNTPGYNENNMFGSVRDYFLAQSYGRLTIDFDIAGPVTMSHNSDYYGSNNSHGDDAHPAEMVAEAVKAVTTNIDFSNYDWNGDGYVDQVYIIYAGTGESQSSKANDIWPHEWSLSEAAFSSDGDGAISINGVVIDTYACSNELYGKSQHKLDGIGTACHEFSHCLGLPDVYDTSGSNFGMDSWDLMDYGCYNGDSYIPASYTAYERWFAGWTEPIVLDDGCTIESMGNIDLEGECYVIYNRAYTNEYYMLQNINKTGWNSDAMAEGMLIIHVDYDKSAWENNKVNASTAHQRMSPVCCDNKPTRNSRKGDLWPYLDITEFSDTSIPAATLFHPNDDNRRFLGRSITDITKNADNTISFTFNGGKQDAAIATVNARTGSSREIYDIFGRRIKGIPQHGLYISGGKKKLCK